MNPICVSDARCHGSIPHLKHISATLIVNRMYLLSVTSLSQQLMLLSEGTAFNVDISAFKKFSRLLNDR